MKSDSAGLYWILSSKCKKIRLSRKYIPLKPRRRYGSCWVLLENYAKPQKANKGASVPFSFRTNKRYVSYIALNKPSGKSSSDEREIWQAVKMKREQEEIFEWPKELTVSEEIKTRKSELPSVMLDLKKSLDKEGIKTTLVNPFFVWMNRDYRTGDSQGYAAATTMYIVDIEIPKVAPFDMLSIEIRVMDERFYFALIIYFHSVMEGLLEAEEFNEIFSKHDELWMPQLVSLLQPVEWDFSFKWDTEYDETIEDTLYGYFPLSDADRLIEAVRSINLCKG